MVVGWPLGGALMKVTPEDMAAVRVVLREHFPEYGPRGTDDRLDIALALILVGIWDRGYDTACQDLEAAYQERQPKPQCPYTHAHTREWCGYVGCRES